jgi:hypothetical protein
VLLRRSRNIRAVTLLRQPPASMLGKGGLDGGTPRLPQDVDQRRLASARSTRRGRTARNHYLGGERHRRGTDQVTPRRAAWPDLASRASGQAEPSCPIQQVLDGGGVPAGSAARRAFVHDLELGGDLLERAARRCGFDAGDQPDQPIIAWLGSSPA